MTKFKTLDENNSGSDTEFEYELASIEEGVISTDQHPTDFDHVLFIGFDRLLGDVFKAWDDGREEEFTLFFGTKGDEFND